MGIGKAETLQKGIFQISHHPLFDNWFIHFEFFQNVTILIIYTSDWFLRNLEFVRNRNLDFVDVYVFK